MMRRRFHPMMQRCLVSIISTCNIILRHTNSSSLYVDCGEIESIHVEWTKTTPRVYCRKRQALTCDRWISPTNQITTPNGVSFYSGYQSGRRRHYWGSQVSDSVVCSLSTHRAAATRLQFTWEQLKTNSGMSSTRKNTTKIKKQKINQKKHERCNGKHIYQQKKLMLFTSKYIL